jgi:hypothetical protein
LIDLLKKCKIDGIASYLPNPIATFYMILAKSNLAHLFVQSNNNRLLLSYLENSTASKYRYYNYYFSKFPLFRLDQMLYGGQRITL